MARPTASSGALNPTSDRAAKENFAPVDNGAVLDKVLALPISRWNFKQEPGVTHLGQPEAGGPLTGGPFTVTGGFWVLPQVVQTEDAPTLYVTLAAPDFATLWWTPQTGTRWVLQEATRLSPPNWTNAPSGATNPVTVPATLPAKFYRLHKP